MAHGSIDIYTSRRNEFDECAYWSRDDDEQDLSKYAYENDITGIFYAKEMSALSTQKNNVGGVFLYDEDSITIETSDIVSIKAGDIVRYDDKLWLVMSVQKKEIHKRKQFLKDSFYKTYIQLKG